MPIFDDINFGTPGPQPTTQSRGDVSTPLIDVVAGKYLNISASTVPHADNTYDFGSPDLRWKMLWGTASLALSSSRTETAALADYATSANYSFTSVTASYVIPTSTSSVVVQTGSLTTIQSVGTASFVGIFFDYAAISGSNQRIGTVMGQWQGASSSFCEFCLTDLGNTSSASLSFRVTQSMAQLLAQVNSKNWTIRSSVRFI